MIPILTMKRPNSNFNSENEIKNNEKLDCGNEIINCHISHNSRNKNIKKNESKEKINISMKNKELFNLLSGMQKIMPNFHKIKIEKGMINSNKRSSSYSKNISYRGENVISILYVLRSV